MVFLLLVHDAIALSNPCDDGMGGDQVGWSYRVARVLAFPGKQTRSFLVDGPARFHFAIQGCRPVVLISPLPAATAFQGFGLKKVYSLPASGPTGKLSWVRPLVDKAIRNQGDLDAIFTW
jgi:hypothetical protein